MKGLKLYLETTVWNFLATEKESQVRGPAMKLFEDVKQKGYRIYISPLVIVEIERTKKAKRLNCLKRLIEEYKPEFLKDINEKCIGRI